MSASQTNHDYCLDLFKQKRFPTIEVTIGKLKLGGTNPIRVQSMTTVDTMDTLASVEQSIRMIDAGCELVRLTAPSKKEAENLKNIKEELLKRGYDKPLVADIHYTPNAAETASKIVEKVRVNPGNYADKKKFEEIEYTDESYNEEIVRIEEKFTPLIQLCKEYNTALRIGTNHGSLSDRILSRYGDTPEGMVESAMEFVRICEKNNFQNLVISMKASNTLVMVQAYRLLTSVMLQNGTCYPLHLGVTEAGDGEDGRIKSAVGIGSLLVDGIGDTIRVSLTEDPEEEIPVAQKLIKLLTLDSTQNLELPSVNGIKIPYSPFHFERRESSEIMNIGEKNAPIVVGDLSDKEVIKPSNMFSFGYNYSVQTDKWSLQETAVDYIFSGDNLIDFELPGTLRVIVNYKTWALNYQSRSGFYPFVSLKEMTLIDPGQICFTLVDNPLWDFNILKEYPNAIIVLNTAHKNKTQIYRYFRFIFANLNIKNPVILQFKSTEKDSESFQLEVGGQAGSLLIDGFGDGIWITGNQANNTICSTSFGILQATRARISKTEYISCPSCGRTLFDLQETTAKIRKETAHLKGLKIGIMGCIVNGPGEMADADYGYVGTGPGKITLYKEKTVVKKNVPEEEAVIELIELIKENGDWKDPN